MLVEVRGGVDVLVAGLGVFVEVGNGELFDTIAAVLVAVGVGETYFVAVGSGVSVVVSTFVPVGKSRVGVAWKRVSGVMVGTGDDSTACNVPIRSCGIPVAGISRIISLRIFLLMDGTSKARGSWL